MKFIPEIILTCATIFVIGIMVLKKNKNDNIGIMDTVGISLVSISATVIFFCCAFALFVYM